MNSDGAWYVKVVTDTDEKYFIVKAEALKDVAGKVPHIPTAVSMEIVYIGPWPKAVIE